MANILIKWWVIWLVQVAVLQLLDRFTRRKKIYIVILVGFGRGNIRGKMERQPVEGSNIESVGYDPDGQILEVEFKSGGVYQYSGVESEMFRSLMDAKSIGSFLRTNIVQGDYEATKVNKVEEEGII